MIVVIDTNVWISALQFAKHRGTPTLALEQAISEDVIATCDEIDGEIVRVLTEKFSWEQHRATSALQAILARCIRVKIRGTVKVCRDPRDDMFLECAALNVLKRHLHPLLKELGIQKCGLHAFRHGRVSFLVEHNVPLPMIRLWIGHGSDKMVARYTHARPEFHANEIAKLPSIANIAVNCKQAA